MELLKINFFWWENLIKLWVKQWIGHTVCRSWIQILNNLENIYLKTCLFMYVRRRRLKWLNWLETIHWCVNRQVENLNFGTTKNQFFIFVWENLIKLQVRYCIGHTVHRSWIIWKIYLNMNFISIVVNFGMIIFELWRDVYLCMWVSNNGSFWGLS